MKFNLKKANYFACLALMAGVYCSCQDANYDLTSIDNTTAILGDSLALPKSFSTKQICLEDMLELSKSKEVRIDKSGAYWFEIKGDEQKNSFTIAEPAVFKSKTTQGGMNLDLSSLLLASSATRATLPSQIKYQGTIAKIDYLFTNIPKDIIELKNVETQGDIQLTISFAKGICRCFKNIEQLKLRVPEFLQLADIRCKNKPMSIDQQHLITLNNVVPTEEGITLTAKVKGMNLEKANDNTHFIAGKELKLNGTFDLSGKISKRDVLLSQLPQAITDNKITTKLTIGDTKIIAATGRFAPNIELPHLGGAEINKLPAFLLQPGVVFNLYNPCINLLFQSQLPISAAASATIVGYNNKGNKLSSVDVPPFEIEKNKNTVVSIRKQKAALKDTVLVHVPQLSNLMRTIPSSIRFQNVQVGANDNEICTIKFQHQYNVVSNFEVKTPLAFDTDACIVYQDTLKGWNGNIGKLNFVPTTPNSDNLNDVAIIVSGIIENKIPLSFQLAAKAIDTEGKEIDDNLLKIEILNNIEASPDGINASQTKQIIKIVPLKKNIIEQLDGIKLTLKGTPTLRNSSLAGIHLNAYQQGIKIKDVTATIKGRLFTNDN